MTSSDIRYGSSKQYQARIYYPTVAPKGIINMYHGLGEVGKGLNAVEVHEIPKLFRLGIDKDYIVVAPYLASGSSWPKNQIIATLELLSDLKDQHKLENLICTGLSLGGIATIASIYWAYTESGIDNFFTAAVVVCGKTGSTDMTPFLKTPIRWYHGTEDKTISINNARTFYNRLRAEGGEITLIEYQGMGHGIWSKAYNDESGNFWDWIKRFDVITTPYVEVVQNMVVISGELYCFTDLNKYKVNATLTKV